MNRLIVAIVLVLAAAVGVAPAVSADTAVPATLCIGPNDLVCIS